LFDSAAALVAVPRIGLILKEMTFTLSVLDRLGNVLKTEDFSMPDGVLERVEALKKEWAEAHRIQVRANDTPLFSIDLKRH